MTTQFAIIQRIFGFTFSTALLVFGKKYNYRLQPLISDWLIKTILFDTLLLTYERF